MIVSLRRVACKIDNKIRNMNLGLEMYRISLSLSFLKMLFSTYRQHCQSQRYLSLLHCLLFYHFLV